MTLVYYSNVTKNTERFVAKTGLPSAEIADGIPDDCIIVTPTYGRAAIPVQVIKALKSREDRDKIRAVIATGNRNFGDNFCAGGRDLARRLGVPILHELELAGTEKDVKAVQYAYAELMGLACV